MSKRVLHVTNGDSAAEWSDGHGSGIYPWERLLAACPCPECAARRARAISGA